LKLSDVSSASYYAIAMYIRTYAPTMARKAMVGWGKMGLYVQGM